MRARKKSDGEQGIDISPLIDMVFILLIFFMVSTTFQKDMDIDISRPKASSATRSSTKAIRIFIAADGTTYMDGQPIRSWMIQSRVRDLLETGNADESVLVVTDGSVPTRKLVEVVDQCRMAGAKDVGVATELEVGR
ncbi:MAG: biopolymer transporter ExbD [Myxococcota bacterium]